MMSHMLELEESLSSLDGSLEPGLTSSSSLSSSLNLPDGPSLRLGDDDGFYKSLMRTSCSRKDESTPQSHQQTRFFQAVPKIQRPRYNAEDFQDEYSPPQTKLPISNRVRKIEIELAQRRLPRYPSQTWRQQAAFYPLRTNRETSLASTTTKEIKIQAFIRSRLLARQVQKDAKQRQRKLKEEQRLLAKERKRQKRQARKVEREQRQRRGQRSKGRERQGVVASTTSSTPPHNIDDSENASMVSSSIFTFTATSTLSGGDTTSSDEESDFIEYVIDDKGEGEDVDDDDDEYFYEEILDEVVDVFYGEEHTKLQQVHSHNLELLDADQEQRRLDATLQTHCQQVVRQHQAEQQLEKYRVKMALYHVVKWAEEDAREEAERQGLSPDAVQKPVQWNADSQFQFLHDFSSRRTELKDALFPVVEVEEEEAEEEVAKGEGEHLKADLNDCRNRATDSCSDDPDADPLILQSSFASLDNAEKHASFSSLPSSYNNPHHQKVSEAAVDDDENHSVNDDYYEPQVGYIPPSLQALILQAQSELRHVPPPPPEHQAKYKPLCIEASEIGQFTRLKEHVVEGTGRRTADVVHLPSTTWKAGHEQVHLAKAESIAARRSDQHMILAKAAALGQMKALKEKVTTNYDTLSDRVAMFENRNSSNNNNNNNNNNHHHDDVLIDDETHAKKIRIKHLTDLHVSEHRTHKSSELWDADVLERQSEVHYDRLEDVPLPTEECPTLPPERLQRPNNTTGMQLREAMAQAVAEASWERRYRLERPRAEQRIRRICRCKWCSTKTGPNPYQTLAYRKRWLESQGILRVEEDEHTIEEDKEEQEEEEEAPSDVEEHHVKIKQDELPEKMVDTEQNEDQQEGLVYDTSSFNKDKASDEKIDEAFEFPGVVEDGYTDDVDELHEFAMPDDEDDDDDDDDDYVKKDQLADQCLPPMVDTLVESFHTTRMTLDTTFKSTEFSSDDDNNMDDASASPTDSDIVLEDLADVDSAPLPPVAVPTKSISTGSNGRNGGILSSVLSVSTHSVRSLLGFSTLSRHSSSRHSTASSEDGSNVSATAAGLTASSSSSSSRRQRQRQKRIQQVMKRKQDKQKRRGVASTNMNSSHSGSNGVISSQPLTSSSLHSFAEE